MSKTVIRGGRTLDVMTDDRTILVYGATGHTGRFVVSELRRRGWDPIASGRDRERLNALAAEEFGGVEVRHAVTDSARSLDRALAGAAAVVNCAGPFFWTAAPVIEAALRARIPYLDVAAEAEAVADAFANYDRPARDAGVPVLAAMAFFGGLGDLLATAVADDGQRIDQIDLAYAIDSWQPTPGTRAAGEVSRRRREGKRIAHREGRLLHHTDAPLNTEWTFPAPVGTTEVVGDFTTADSVTIPRHLDVQDIRTFMSTSAVVDLTDPSAPPPTPADESGRSAQRFLVHLVAHSRGSRREAIASGRDIYAFSAPLIVEAMERVVRGAISQPGVLTSGQAFAARDFLQALPLDHLSIS